MRNVEHARLFRVLTEKEVEDARQWARDHYHPGDDINGCWHPVVRRECEQINVEEVQKQKWVDYVLQEGENSGKGNL